MAGRIIIPGISPALTANGEIDPTASFQFYVNRTTTPQDIFTTADLDVNLSNPLTPDSAGRLPEIWGADGNIYTVEWTPTGEAPITFNDIALSAVPNPATSYFPVSRLITTKPTNGQTLIIWNVPFPMSLPQDLNDGSFPSLFTIATLPTATMPFQFYKNGVLIGSVSFSTAGVPTVTFNAAVSFAEADQFSMTGPATADSTGNYIAMTILFTIN